MQIADEITIMKKTSNKKDISIKSLVFSSAKIPFVQQMQL